MVDDIEISRAIIERYMKKLLDHLENDVAIVGAGPAGLMAAYDLARNGAKVVVFERKLSIGGGMWGGGMMLNEIVVHEEGKEVLDELGVKYEAYGSEYYTAGSVETATTLCSKAIRAGATVFNLVAIEDVRFDGEKINGLVINWSAVEMAGLHVDPLTVSCDHTIDATGHDLEVVRVLKEKTGAKLMTPSGNVEGEGAMWAERGEKGVVENTKEIFPGIIVSGMAANAAFGDFRMGPIFGGMLLSGRRAAETVLEKMG